MRCGWVKMALLILGLPIGILLVVAGTWGGFGGLMLVGFILLSLCVIVIFQRYGG
jgi:hypothetical protein